MHFQEEFDSQIHLTELTEVFVDLARLNDPVTDNDKTGVLLKSLPESYGFIALISDANKMEYESIFALLKLKMEQGKEKNKKSDISLANAAAQKYAYAASSALR